MMVHVLFINDDWQLLMVNDVATNVPIICWLINNQQQDQGGTQTRQPSNQWPMVTPFLLWKSWTAPFFQRSLWTRSLLRRSGTLGAQRCSSCCSSQRRSVPDTSTKTEDAQPQARCNRQRRTHGCGSEKLGGSLNAKKHNPQSQSSRWIRHVDDGSSWRWWLLMFDVNEVSSWLLMMRWMFAEVVHDCWRVLTVLHGWWIFAVAVNGLYIMNANDGSWWLTAHVHGWWCRQASFCTDTCHCKPLSTTISPANPGYQPLLTIIKHEH